ncbi:MAG: diguanylate cyclase domain-containing protein [Betaproteobacteria bacterium]
MRTALSSNAEPAAVSRRFARLLPVALGVGLLVIGLVIMTGWVLQEPRLLLLIPGYRIVFNTALCFALAASALICNVLGARPRMLVQTTIGAVLVLFAGTVLSQHFTGVGLGLDWSDMHAWLRGSSAYPGRMAPATCVAFLSSGACLIAMHHARGKSAPYLIRGLQITVIGIGLFAAIGQILGLASMFEVYLFRQVSLPTASGFVFLGTALWLSTERLVFDNISDEERILYTGATVLVVFGFIVGLAGLGTLKINAEAALGEGLELTASSRASLLTTLIDSRIEYVESIATRPNILRLYQELVQQPDGAENREFLGKVAASELKRGFFFLEFRNSQGGTITAAGKGWPDTARLFNLKRPHNAQIFWDDGFVLSLEVPVRDGAKIIGTISSQQTLAAVKDLVLDVSTFGNTGELGLCSADDRLLYCAPQRLRRSAHEIPRRPGGRPLPMDHAIEGKTGVVQTLDYRRQQVLAAYTPVSDMGLGLVLKIDTAELFQPLRNQLAYIVLLKLLLLAAGVFVLRLAVTPLTSKLRGSRQQLSLALQASRLALWDLYIPSGKIYLSEQWNAMRGGPDGPAFTTLAELRLLVHPEDAPLVDAHLGEVLKGRAYKYDIDHRVQKQDGSWFWIRSRGEVVERDPEGRALRLTGTNADVSVRKSLEQQLVHQATHDVLTGLPNRSLFHDRLKQAMARCARNGTLMAVMYLDIDKFKAINDTLGHDMGDRLLKAFSRRLTDCVRATDTVARLGGDEYAVVLENLGVRENGERIAEKIVQSMRPEFVLENRALAITTSIGMAFHEGRVEIGQDRLIKQADEALYQAKGAGRNNYKVFGEQPG